MQDQDKRAAVEEIKQRLASSGEIDTQEGIQTLTERFLAKKFMEHSFPTDSLPVRISFSS